VSRATLLQEMTREDARAIAPTAIALLPTGATEQHGPHLPTGTDTFAVEQIARHAAEAAAAQQIPVVVTPTLPFGSSHHHLPFGGTMSIGTETYYRLVSDLAESLILGGFRRIFILNGHGGNHEIIQLVARDLALKHESHLAAASYWAAAWDALLAAEAPALGRLPGHAGAFETSLILALRPDLVREPRPHRDEAPSEIPPSFAQPIRIELHGSWQRTDGFSDSPDRGSAARGAALLHAAAGAVGDALVRFYQSTESTG
jgi:creatinine amidohydrolase